MTTLQIFLSYVNAHPHGFTGSLEGLGVHGGLYFKLKEAGLQFSSLSAELLKLKLVSDGVGGGGGTGWLGSVEDEFNPYKLEDWERFLAEKVMACGDMSVFTDVRITGHSLGGGVAMLLTAFINLGDDFGEEKPEDFDLSFWRPENGVLSNPVTKAYLPWHLLAKAALGVGELDESTRDRIRGLGLEAVAFLESMPLHRMQPLSGRVKAPTSFVYKRLVEGGTVVTATGSDPGKSVFSA